MTTRYSQSRWVPLAFTPAQLSADTGATAIALAMLSERPPQADGRCRPGEPGIIALPVFEVGRGVERASLPPSETLEVRLVLQS
jgi:hypothetical protein